MSKENLTFIFYNSFNTLLITPPHLGGKWGYKDLSKIYNEQFQCNLYKVTCLINSLFSYPAELFFSLSFPN